MPTKRVRRKIWCHLLAKNGSCLLCGKMEIPLPICFYTRYLTIWDCEQKSCDVEKSSNNFLTNFLISVGGGSATMLIVQILYGISFSVYLRVKCNSRKEWKRADFVEGKIRRFETILHTLIFSERGCAIKLSKQMFWISFILDTFGGFYLKKFNIEQTDEVSKRGIKELKKKKVQKSHYFVKLCLFIFKFNFNAWWWFAQFKWIS